MRSKLVPFCLLLAAIFFFESCLTIGNPGYKTTVRINAEPSGTHVSINGKDERECPVKVRLKKRKSHELVFTNKGYLDEKVSIKNYQNFNLYTLAMTSWLFTLGVVGLLDVFGTSYYTPFKTIQVDMLKKPEKTESKVPIGFGEVTVTIDPGKKVGSMYDFKHGRINKKTFSKSLNWGDDTKIDATRLAQIGVDELPKYGYNVVANSEKSAFSNEKNARIMITAKIEDMSVMVYNGRDNVYSVVNFDVNWSIKDSRGKEMLKMMTKASSTKYNDGDRSIFLDAYRKALFDLVSSKDFAGLLSSFENTIETKKEVTSVTMLDEVKSKSLESTEALIKEVSQSVVTVVTELGHGSGFIISENGLIITNHHVVQNAEDIKVEFSNGLILKAEILSVAEDEDIVLLKLPGAGYKPLKLLSGAESDLGKEVYAIGTPADRSLGQSVTKGIISGKRKLNEKIYIQTDVSVNGGNSGGPLIDKSGNVVGIVNAKLRGEGIEGLSFAIPSSTAIKSLNLQYR